MSEEELMEVAESVHDGWYRTGRIDWDDFLYRLESQADVDLGNDADSPLIRRIKSRVRAHRRAMADDGE